MIPYYLYYTGLIAIRGDAKMKHLDFSGAIEDYSKFIELKPNYPDVYYHRGSAKSKLGDHAGAMMDFNKGDDLGYNAEKDDFYKEDD